MKQKAGVMHVRINGDVLRPEEVVMLRNRHVIIAHCAIFAYAISARNEPHAYTARAVARMASFKCIVDKNGTQYSLTPLMECKEAFDYTIPSFSVIIYLVSRSHTLLLARRGSGLMRVVPFAAHTAIQSDC